MPLLPGLGSYNGLFNSQKKGVVVYFFCPKNALTNRQSFKTMLQLSELWIYPIKSLGGISLTQAQVTDRGLGHDRRWLLVDESGMFLSQREHPMLALFQPSFDGNVMVVSFQKTATSVEIPLRYADHQSLFTVTVWEDSVQAFEVDPAVSTWFSQLLGFSARLVYMPDQSHRKVESKYAISPNDITSFSDAYPFLIIGQSSLDDLNNRIKKPISMNRFRPNFVFTGGEPYEEETWSEFKIGAVTFYGVKPCGRCVMTTVDPTKGVVSGKEPLKTLAKYRLQGNSVIFGQNAIGTGAGVLFLGDEVTVVVRK